MSSSRTARAPGPPLPFLQGHALPWPTPALLVWGAAWGTAWLAGWLGVPGAACLLAGTTLGAGGAVGVDGRWRRALTAAGFPLSALALGVPAPPWAWMTAAALLALAYPLRAWRDAPWFPTPRGALAGLPAVLPLPDGARVLDAGCGLGHGLRALRAAWPTARLDGVEWSRPLAWACRRVCRFAGVRRADMWAVSWAAYDLVYLFQRPESMPRALAKAQAELRAGAWLVSLEFALPGVEAVAAPACSGGRPLWIYRADGALNRSPRRPITA